MSVPRLLLCDTLWGADTLIESDPAASTWFGAIYRPLRPDIFLDSDPDWGLYSATGDLIADGAYARLPTGVLIGQSPHLPPPATPEPAPDLPYVYGGPVIMHYGHFLTAALPRLWQLVRNGWPTGCKILVHSHQDPASWFERDFVRETLGRLGLGPSDFVQFTTPTRLRRVEVPRPAMQEQSFVHQVFGELCAQIGVKPPPPIGAGAPIYLSKTRHAQGTTRLLNEDEIEAAMTAHGIEVLHPHEMSFSAQLAALSGASAVLGTIGSAFHTSLFCPAPLRIVGLAYGRRINANYALIDRVCNNNATYVYPETGLTEVADGSATFCYRLEHAGAIAHALLGII